MRSLKPHVKQTAPELGPNVIDMISATLDLIQKSGGEKRAFYQRKFDEICSLEYLKEVDQVQKGA